MIVRRTTDSNGSKQYLVASWLVNSILVLLLAWVTSMSAAVFNNSVELGRGPRFTAYDAAIMQAAIDQLSNEILDIAVLFEACDAKIEADRDRRAEVHAEFQLFRRELMDHAREDDRRFGAWLHTLPDEPEAGGLIGPWLPADPTESQ